jgi:hypothetical protein
MKSRFSAQCNPESRAGGGSELAGGKSRTVVCRSDRESFFAPLRCLERDDRVRDRAHQTALAIIFRDVIHRQKRMRTSNALEQVNQELKRRARVARVFPNEKPLLHLITALLVETSDEWETGTIHLNMNP